MDTTVNKMGPLPSWKRLLLLIVFMTSFCVSIHTIDAFQANNNSILRVSSYLGKEISHTQIKNKLGKTTISNFHGHDRIKLSVSSSFRDNSAGDRSNSFKNKLDSVAIDSHPLLKDLDNERRLIIKMLTSEQDYKHVSGKVEGMLKMVKASQKEKNMFRSEREKKNVLHASSLIIDATMRSVTNRAFAFPIYTAPNVIARVFAGIDVVEMQLRKKTKGILTVPYTTVPRSTVMKAIRALNKLTPNKSSTPEENASLKWAQRRAHVAFSLLKRLISGIGIRHEARNGINITKRFMIEERDFSSVLRAFVEIGKMDMAHKVMALQERSVNAPSLSSVPYSILIKAYGTFKDSKNVERVWGRTINSIKPDVIMCNSAIDAFINCDQLRKAEHIFNSMMQSDEDKLTRHSLYALPLPNIRTFNTMLKGYAKNASWDKASKLYKRIEEIGLEWDHVTTNTLVSAAISSGSFDTAESILANHTQIHKTQTQATQYQNNNLKKHPNVEAYTELLNGYAKADMLNKALSTLKLMRDRGVGPNEYTYSSMIGALARSDKLEQANKMLDFMENVDKIRPNVVTYNAFLTGILTRPEIKQVSYSDAALTELSLSMEEREQVASHLLSKMMKSKVRPNTVTVSTLTEFLTIHCNPPKISVAKELIEKLDETATGNEYKYMNDKQVATILIKAYGLSGDLELATNTFLNINRPDTVAVNAYLDACCECDKVKLAIQTFEQLCNKKTRTISPDVVTYSVIISALLKYKDNPRASSKARVLYREMKNVEGIFPDTGLVDLILTAMITGGRIGVDKEDIKFTLEVLKDTESLVWPKGYLERRQKIVRQVLLSRVSEVWKVNEDSYYGMNMKTEDPLFKKKGWNTVDSGFRLWGDGGFDNYETSEKFKISQTSDSDEFLESKGWNDMDSGFRLL